MFAGGRFIVAVVSACSFPAELPQSWLEKPGEGGGEEGPSPGSINSIFWGGGPGRSNNYIEKIVLFTSLELLFSNCHSCIGGFGPFEILGDPFP